MDGDNCKKHISGKRFQLQPMKSKFYQTLVKCYSAYFVGLHLTTQSHQSFNVSSIHAKKATTSFPSVSAWRWRYTGPAVVGNVSDNRVSSYRLHACIWNTTAVVRPDGRRHTHLLLSMWSCERTAVNQWRADLQHSPSSTTVKRKRSLRASLARDTVNTQMR